MKDNITIVVLAGMFIVAILFASLIDSKVNKPDDIDYKRLYLECNGTISRANKDSLMYLKIEK